MQTIGMAQRMNKTLNHQQIGHVLAVRDMHQCSTTTTVLHTCQSQTQVIINQLWAHKKGSGIELQ